MLVRVKKEIGNYGLRANGFVRPVNWATGAFRLSPELATSLLQRGVVERVEEGEGEDSPSNTKQKKTRRDNSKKS